MEREEAYRGIQKLKSRIKELAAKQKDEKSVMRLPRKTKEDLEHLRSEVNRVSPSSYGYEHDISYVQSTVAVRKFEISAYLNVYAQVRGKAPCHTPREGWEYYLPRSMKKAREEFDKACSTTSEQCSAHSPIGRNM